MGLGIDHFDHVYFINLKHRTDRYDHITHQLSHMEVQPERIRAIDAVYCKNFGILGCGKSHILALETFINSPTGDNCLILEDDFTFCNSPPETARQIDHFFEHFGSKYNVFMLSYNVLQDEPTQDPTVRRVLRGQTLSGYGVTREYAPRLLENFKKGVSMLEILGYSEHEYCVDVHVKELQISDSWYYPIPKIGKQMESYSDIQQSTTNHHC